MSRRAVPRPVSAPVRLLLLLLLALGLVVGLAPAAEAHALLESSTPGDGATLDAAPRELVLVFDEDVTLATVQVRVVDESGTVTSAPAARGEAGAETASTVHVPMPPLGRGRFLVRWSAVSSDDLHPTDGTLVFGVGTSVEAAGRGDDTLPGADGVGEGLLRWIALLGFGIALAGLLLRRRLSAASAGAWSPVTTLRRTVPRAALVGLVALAGLAALYVARVAVVGGLLPVLATPAVTLRWLLALLAAGLGLVLVRADSLRHHEFGAAACLAVAAAATTSTGHPATAGGATAALGALHTVVTVVWAGGVACVAVVAVAARRHGDRTSGRVAARAFTPIALVTLGTGLVTGLLLTGALLPSVGAVLSTSYGHLLLAKLALVGLALGSAAGTVLFLVRRPKRSPASTGVLAVMGEAVLLSAAVLAAATVAATHPASPSVWAPAADPPATTGELSTFGDDLVLTVGLGPGQPGANFATVGVLDTRRPAPATITSVSVEAGAAAPISAVAQSDPHRWVAKVDLASDGPLPVTVRVVRAGMPDVTATFPWTVAPATGTHLGGAPLAPITDRLAAALALLALLGLVVTVAVRRRRPGAADTAEPVAGQRAAESDALTGS